ncbi:AraC family transcriptional regulator [Cohnella zeiphila]|uniref:AraC family transcriptional regulator n=1 Tax=Cohnella zeiphila TaxID=2761120 RepID=A0A7X0VYF4_9BACL|nr:helix-turn-helix domain-containing protein [Cohnella zeiphila]MBB6734650.1 AraC family transcriptional regulator [Cohnella zeiphila]
MGMIRALGSRKYLRRILIYFNLSAASVLIIFSFSYYFFTKDIVLKTQQDANEKVLTQIKYNINYLNEIVQNIAIMMSFDKSMVYLMNAREPDPFTKFQTLRTLDTVADSTSFVDSIAVYSGAAEQLYVSGSGKWSRDHMDELRKMTLEQLRQFAPSPSGRLVPMKRDEGSSNVDLFSYFVLDSHPSGDALPNAVIVNVRPQWIFDNISNLNELADPRDGILVLDQNGRLLAYHDGKNGGTEEADIETVKRIPRDRPGESGQWSILSEDGRKFYVSEMSIGLNDWRLVSLLSYEKVMGRVESFRNISFLLIAVSLAVSIVLSVAAGNRLYRPVGKLTELFRRHSAHREQEPPSTRDEMSYITGVYRHTLSELESANREEKRNQRIVGDYRLRRWITDSGSMTEAERKECADAHPELFPGEDESPQWKLAVLVPDLPTATPSVQEDLYRFAVCNIAEETLSRTYSARVLDMKNEFIVAVVRLPEGKEDPEELKALLKEAVDTCGRYYRRTFSVSVSHPVSDDKAVSEAYHLTVQQLMYRLLYGRGSVIFPEDVAANMDRQDAAIPPEWEKKLGEAIRSRESKAIRAALDKWFAAISAFPYDEMTFAVQQLVLVIKPLLREPAFQDQVHPVEMQTLGAKVIRSDTLAEMREKIEQFLEQLCQSEPLPQKEDKNRMIVDAIKEFVEKNALDVNLSLQNIASNFKMSTAYVGRIFKQYEKMSVGDYINGHRLEKAREMLLGSDFSVKEIADYLGFNNSSYFITLFKKRFGVTPKDYRFHRTIGAEARAGTQN